jgi:ribosomal protein L6P/L9E
MENFFYSKLILIQTNTTVFKLENRLLIKGPLGVSFLEIPKDVFFKKSKHGYRLFGFLQNKNLVLTYYKLLINKLRGVCLGFFEILLINGVG